MPKQYEISKPVLVTGATGYVAGRLVEALLKEGFTVHATVRNPENQKKVLYLNQIAEKAPGHLNFFKADLLNMDDFNKAMQDCRVVFHTASPFTLRIKDPQKDLVDPALNGTRNVLQQASNIPSVKRVVVTSSCAAIYSDNIDLHLKGKDILTEDDWNEGSSLNHQPYSYSKTVAEREAWRIAEQQDHFQLVTINPSLVIGSGINPYATSETFNLFKNMGNGKMKMGVPHLEMGVVDVRDVARAHIEAGFNPKAHGRYITSGHNTSLFEIAQILREHFGDKYPFPKREVPKWLVWLTGPLMDSSITRQFITKNVDWPFRVDNRKSIEDLGMTYRPLKDSVIDLFQQLLDSGQVSP